jgi:Recombination endonuclease VII
VNRLKPKDLKDWRIRQLKKQSGLCKLCRFDLEIADAVADHCHQSGLMRGVLHRGCNAWLGKTENSIRINKLQGRIENLVSQNVLHYMSTTLEDYHPSFRTEEEKRVRRNKKARKRRASKSKRT